MARKKAKCGTCLDLLWFKKTDVPPQAVVCTCMDTILTESGAVGNPIALTAQDIEDIEGGAFDGPGIGRDDLKDMRAIFDAASIARPRHCFRWSATESRWELSEVRAIHRTLIASIEDGVWVEV